MIRAKPAGNSARRIPSPPGAPQWMRSIRRKMGSTETPITVFQDFFVDLDLPVSMSLDDEVSVPVTCYNYLKEPQEVHLRLTSANWFECFRNRT